jgi:hypothetical protein
MRYIALLLPLSLAACMRPDPIVEYRTVTVEIPVSVPCISPSRPTEVTPVRQRVTRAEWDAMTTDQRERLLLANGMRRKGYSDELYAATAGCQ